MKKEELSRRDFVGRLGLVAFGGLLAGTGTARKLFAEETQTGQTADKHACCGLNGCKSAGASGDNSCAGMGTCSTTEAHGCSGANACKNQGGTGENDCKGKGSCAVPIKGDSWKAARAKFEERMTRAGKTFGPAPDSCGK